MKSIQDITFNSGEVTTFLGSEKSDLKSLAEDIKYRESKSVRNVIFISKNIVNSIFKDTQEYTKNYSNAYRNFQNISYREDILFNDENNLIIIEDLDGLTSEQEKFIFSKDYKSSVIVFYFTTSALVLSAFSLDKHYQPIINQSNKVIFIRKYIEVSYSLLELT